MAATTGAATAVLAADCSRATSRVPAGRTEFREASSKPVASKAAAGLLACVGLAGRLDALFSFLTKTNDGFLRSFSELEEFSASAETPGGAQFGPYPALAYSCCSAGSEKSMRFSAYRWPP